MEKPAGGCVAAGFFVCMAGAGRRRQDARAGIQIFIRRIWRFLFANCGSFQKRNSVAYEFMNKPIGARFQFCAASVRFGAKLGGGAGSFAKRAVFYFLQISSFRIRRRPAICTSFFHFATFNHRRRFPFGRAASNANAARKALFGGCPVQIAGGVSTPCRLSLKKICLFYRADCGAA